MRPATSGPFEIGREPDGIAATTNELRVYGVTIIKKPEMSLAGIRGTSIAAQMAHEFHYARRTENNGLAQYGRSPTFFRWSVEKFHERKSGKEKR